MQYHYSRLSRLAIALVVTFGIVWPVLAVVPRASRMISWASTASATHNYVSGEVLVKFKPQVTSQLKMETVSGLGDRPMRGLGRSGLVQVVLGAGQTIEGAMAAYRSHPDVEHVQPNYIYKATTIPNDPSYGQLWGLKNTGQAISNASYATNNPGVAGNDMDMELAWDQITDCSSVIVAVIDSGVNYTHQDLTTNMWDGGVSYPNHGWDFVDSDNDPMPTDVDGHGTHVAGTIAAAGNNGLGITGVCWMAKIMAIRSLSMNGGTTVAIIQGIDFAIQRGAKVINMSFEGSGFDPAFSDAITNVRNAGVVVVAAAGNEANNNDTGAAGNSRYPCNFTQDNLICVAALDQAYARANFTNYGSTSVDVGAPGTNTMSTWPGVTTQDDFSTGWTFTSGWSAVLCNLRSGLFRMLVNPSNWCANGSYANNANDVAYKTFDLNGALAASAGFLAFRDTEVNNDFFGIAYKSNGGNPFEPGGTLLPEQSGSTGGFSIPHVVNLNNCRTVSCSLGFRLRSNPMNTDFGIGILLMSINRAEPNSNVYQNATGTSMASPHVAGLAAMIMAYNPSYTYTDAVSSIKNGGDPVASLAGVTTTGRAVNAMGSLRYINPPTGVSAVVQ